MTEVIGDIQTNEEIDAEEPLVAHIVHRDDSMRGYILGERIMAVCGYTFIPSRNPEDKPMCEECREAIGRLLSDKLSELDD